MCQCNPQIKTPYCGGAGCLPLPPHQQQLPVTLESLKVRKGLAEMNYEDSMKTAERYKKEIYTLTKKIEAFEAGEQECQQ